MMAWAVLELALCGPDRLGGTKTSHSGPTPLGAWATSPPQNPYHATLTGLSVITLQAEPNCKTPCPRCHPFVALLRTRREDKRRDQGLLDHGFKFARIIFPLSILDSWHLFEYGMPNGKPSELCGYRTAASYESPRLHMASRNRSIGTPTDSVRLTKNG